MSLPWIITIEQVSYRGLAVALSWVLVAGCEPAQPAVPGSTDPGQRPGSGTVSLQSNVDGGAASQPSASKDAAQEQEQRYEQFLAADPRDDAWAPAQEKHLWKSLEKMPTVKVRDALCKSKLCRLRLEFASAAGQTAFADDLRGAGTGFMQNVHGDGRRGVVYSINHDYSTLTSRFWVSRPGYSFPAPDGTVTESVPPKPRRAPIPASPEGGTP